jgi:hypothetical protein
MVAVIKKLWDVAWDLWEHRNGFLHDAEYQETLYNMANVNAEIRFQFERGCEKLPQRVRYLFEGNLSELLTTSVQHRHKWLATVTAAREMADERQALQDQSLAASRQLMRAWLDGRLAGGS